MVPTAAWGPEGERTGRGGRVRPPGHHPTLGTPDPRSLGPTSTGPRLLDDVFDQPVDPLVQSQAPEKRDLPGRRALSWASGPRPAAAQPHRPRPEAGPPSPAGDQPGSSRGAPTPQERRRHGGDRAALGCNGVIPFPGQGQRRGPTHRVQLPLEYDEGHETDNDKQGAEAQVGKEVAGEIAWVRQGDWGEDRA